MEKQTVLLTAETDPTDEQLLTIMQGIGAEARQKALHAERELREKIHRQIKEAQARHHCQLLPGYCNG